LRVADRVRLSDWRLEKVRRLEIVTDGVEESDAIGRRGLRAFAAFVSESKVSGSLGVSRKGARGEGMGNEEGRRSFHLS